MGCQLDAGTTFCNSDCDSCHDQSGAPVNPPAQLSAGPTCPTDRSDYAGGCKDTRCTYSQSDGWYQFICQLDAGTTFCNSDCDSCHDQSGAPVNPPAQLS